MFPNTKIVEAIRKEYPAGTRVRLLKMDDVQAPPIGTESAKQIVASCTALNMCKIHLLCNFP